MNREKILAEIHAGNVIRKDFLANPNAGIWEHQFSVEILFTGHEYWVRFLPYGGDSGYLIRVTKEQVNNFVHLHYAD